MSDECPAMKAQLHPFVLLLPSAPVKHFTLLLDKVNDLPMIPGPVCNVSNDATASAALFRDRASPPFQTHDLNILYSTFLI